MFACRCEEGEIGEVVLVSIYISVLLLQFCWERSNCLRAVHCARIVIWVIWFEAVFAVNINFKQVYLIQ